MSTQTMRRISVHALAILLIAAGTPGVTQAEIIGTSTALAAADRAAALERVTATLDREDVRTRLLDLGVAREAIDARLAALTDAELAAFAERLDSAPAGGDTLAVIGLVFVVLLILEVVGVIDIFKSVGSARR